MEGSDSKAKGPIHILTQDPTRAWDTLKVKQKVETWTPLDPSTPISDDKIRFVCLSDTHQTIEDKPEYVPPGDVLLHGGDFSHVGGPHNIDRFNTFLGKLPHKAKIVIAGNHDMTLDPDMVENKRSDLQDYFNLPRSKFEDVLEELGVSSSRQLLTNCVYLMDSGVDVCGLHIYGSPWQPEFCDWGFNLPRGAPCQEKWDLIPDHTDVLITHGPPIGHGDLCSSGLRAGCVELLTTIQSRVKPRYHLFGHIHEGYGTSTDGQTVFINASNVNTRTKLANPAIVFDLPIPEGHCKAEIAHFPTNNL